MSPTRRPASRNSATLSCYAARARGPLHPSQISIAKKAYSSDPTEVAFAQKILAAMPGGSGAVTIDGKIQDDAPWKQARLIFDLARQVASRNSEFAALNDFAPTLPN